MSIRRRRCASMAVFAPVEFPIAWVVSDKFGNREDGRITILGPTPRCPTESEAAGGVTAGRTSACGGETLAIGGRTIAPS